MKKEETKQIDFSQLEMKIEYVDIGEIHPSPENVKLHPPKQIRRLKASIKSFGFLIPLIIDKSGTIVAGHGRYLAAQELGMVKVPCVRSEHLSDEQVNALRIIDNKLAETGYEQDKMLTLLKDFKVEYLEMAGIDPSMFDPINDELSKYDNLNCEYPLVPKFSEKYSGFIIVAENDIDCAFMENALGCEVSKSYKTKAIGRSYVITVEKFKALWEANKGIVK